MTLKVKVRQNKVIMLNRENLSSKYSSHKPKKRVRRGTVQFRSSFGRRKMALPFPGPNYGILCKFCYTLNPANKRNCSKCRRRLG